MLKRPFDLDLLSRIVECIEKNPDSHFFLDETPLGINAITVDNLIEEISPKICDDRILWIACHTKNRPYELSDDLRDNGNLLDSISSKFYVQLLL